MKFKRIEFIFNKIKADYEYYTKHKFIGIAEALGQAFASRASDILDKLDYMTKQSFATTADKEYLYLAYGQVIPPLPPQKAKGTIAIYGEVGKVVKQYSTLSANGIDYEVQSEATIANRQVAGTAVVSGNNVTLHINNHKLTNCTAEIAGEEIEIKAIDKDTLEYESDSTNSGDNVVLSINMAICNIISTTPTKQANKELNGELIFNTSIDGVDDVAKAILISGGGDDEEVEHYRKRILEFIRQPQAPFNKYHIRQYILENHANIVNIWFGKVEEGLLQVVAINKDYSLSDFDKQEITKSVKAIAPAQMDTSAIEVIAPIVEYVDIQISDLLPQSDGIKNEIIKNLTSLFKDDNIYNTAISADKLKATIYQSANSVEAVESFNLVAGGKTPKANTLYKVGDISFV